MSIHALLEAMPSLSASDLHLKVDSPPMYRINSGLRKVDHPPLTDKDIAAIVDEIITPRKKVILDQQGSVDFAYEMIGVSRFRINVFRQKGRISIAIRTVKLKIPIFTELNLPEDALLKASDAARGLVLVTGVTGSGKSSTLASIIGYMNDTRREHIITIEDPIEYVYNDNMSIINQIEIGVDIANFDLALRQVLRQDPDVILIGELRDQNTVKTALMATETGHLVLATLHTSDATQTINRILHFYEAEDEKMILEQLSLNLKSVISQRLLVAKGGNGRIPAVEIMMGTPIVKKLIREGRITELKQAIKNRDDGMVTFDQYLVELVKKGRVDMEEAIKFVEDESGFRRNVKGIYSEGDRGGLIGGGAQG